MQGSSGQRASFSLTSFPREAGDKDGGSNLEELPFLHVDIQEPWSKPVPAWKQCMSSRNAVLVVIAGIAGIAFVVLLLAVLIHAARGGSAMKYKGPMAVHNPDLVFYIIGDWGRDGNESQQKAAQMMSDVGDTYPPAFVISTGDNFYQFGLSGPDDPKFKRSFTEVYTSEHLDVPWYSILGNHDYGDSYQGNISDCSHLPGSYDLSGCGECCVSPLWQLPEYNAANLDPRWNSQQGAWSKSFLEGRLYIIFIDTPPFISDYYLTDIAKVSGGVITQNPEAQKADVERLLNEASSAQWRLVVGHHPVYSYGHHCATSQQCVEMQWLRPVLQRHKVAAYISGHEHDLQLIQPRNDTVTYVVSGAGSDIREDDFTHKVDTTGLDSSFFTADQGFVVATVKGSMLSLFFYAHRSEDPVATVDLPMWP